MKREAAFFFCALYDLSHFTQMSSEMTFTIQKEAVQRQQWWFFRLKWRHSCFYPTAKTLKQFSIFLIRQRNEFNLNCRKNLKRALTRKKHSAKNSKKRRSLEEWVAEACNTYL